MTVSKHTPGPWEARTVDGSLGTVDSFSGLTVAQTCQLTKDDAMTGHAERKANARLIASAPELLEALQGALRLMEEQVMKLEWEFGECREIEAIEKGGDLPSAVIKARSAIAKATGGKA